MVSINKVDINNLELVQTFLESIPSIKSVEKDIVKNAICASENEKILGVVSYEKFNYYGLVRYFVFKRTLEIKIIEELFKTLTSKAREDNLIKLISVVNNKDVFSLFEGLGFSLIDEDILYIDEKQFLSDDNKNPQIMEYNIVINC